MKIFITFILLAFSINSFGMTKLEQDQSLLKMCINSDDRVFQLNYQISVTDTLVAKAEGDNKLARNNLIQDGRDMSEEDRDFWYAIVKTSTESLDTLRQTRIDLIKEVIETRYKIITACTNKVFSKELIKQVCSDKDERTKRWCQGRFF